MKTLHLINSIRIALKRITLAVPLAAAMWLGAGTSVQAIPLDSLIHYDLDSVSGTTVTNTGSLGSAANGTLANASVVAGKFGNALSFTGSGSGVITNNNVAIGNAFTFACWVSTTNGNSGYKRIILNDYQQSGYLGTNGGGQYLTILKNQFVNSATSPDTSGAWHHLAMTWDGTTQKFYYDGVVNTTNTQSQNTTLTQKIGFGCNLGLGENWNGKMDDAFVFGRALSLAEIGSLYTNAPNTAPAVPTGVAATPVSSGTISVSWVADTNATSRDVSVTNTSTSVEQVFTTSAATSYTVTGLTNGTVYNFKVLATNALGSSAYSSVVSATPTLGTAKNILTFLVPGQPDGVITGTNISVVVPVGTNVTAFSPTYTVSNLASGSPVSGTTRNFTSPQTYTITAEDLSTQDYTVTVTEGTVASIYTWTTGSGNWSDSTKWTNDLSNGLRPGTFGQSYYTLNFNQAVTATNDLSASYVVNKLNFGSTVTLAGNSLALTTNGATLPTLNQNSGSAVTISTPLSLAANTTLGGSNTGTVSISSNITGSGSFTKSNGGTLNLTGTNTYTGGTLISAGTVYCGLQNASPLGGAGTINVTVGSGATLSMDRNQITGNLTLNGGKVAVSNGWSDDRWNGPVALSGNTTIDVGSTDGVLTLNGVVSGTGTLTKLGASVKATPLLAANTFSGTLAITQGTLSLGAAGSINNVSLISIGAAGIFDVSAKSAFALTSNNSLAATSTGATLTTQAKLKGAAGGTVSLASQPVTLNYDGSNPALTITQGTLVLNGNPFTVNTASPLSVGTYNIATQTSGSITSSGTYPGVTGTAIGTGKVGTISVSGSNVVLTVSVPTLTVTAFPSPQTAGVAGSVTVTAKDGAGATATGYIGTVAFTSSDGTATLPSNYTFVAGDNGVHTFTSGVTLRMAGTSSITATQVGTPATTGSQSGITVTPAAAATLAVSGFPASKTEGVADNVTITAKDAFGNTATGYTGTVAITSTDGAAVLPANYTFVGGDNGTKALSVTLNTVSGATVAITATDTTTGSITGTQSGIIVLLGTSAANLQVSGFPSPQTAGVAGSVTITAKRANGTTSTGYLGTVTFTSTDGAATLPSNYTFVAGDNGVHTFTGGVTLQTAGARAITATDTSTAITGTQSSITVNPAAAATLVVTGYPSPQFVGTAGTVTVTAKDAFNNTATGYTGTVAFTSSDLVATLPSNYTFVGGDNGVHAFTNGVTFATAGTQSITTTDTVTGTITGSQSGITVNLVPSIFTWISNSSGFANVATNWTNNAGISYVPDTAGKSNYVLKFPTAGTYTVSNNLSSGFLLNELDFNGATVTLDSLGLAFINNGGVLPQINQNSSVGITVNNNVNFGANTTLGGSGNGAVTLNGKLSGTGSLTKSNSGTLAINYLGDNDYSGGTIITAGTVNLPARTTAAFGTGPMTITNATLNYNAGLIANAMTLNSATLYSSNGFPGSLSGTITMSGTNILDAGNTGHSTISGVISGSGGLKKMGTATTPCDLSGINTYTGDTEVAEGKLTLLDNGGLKFVLADAGVSNKVTGAATVTLNGDFTIDTAAVTDTTGTWTLVNTTTKSFGSTFTVVGFTANMDGVTWAVTDSGKTWTFVETTGVLTLTASVSNYGAWAVTYLPADVSDPAADNDGDGLTNQQEYAFGLNPTLGSSVNPVTAPLDQVTGMFTYTRHATPTASGLIYTVLTSTDLATWTPDLTATQTVTGTASGVETVDVTLSASILPLTDPTLFVRVEAAPTP